MRYCETGGSTDVRVVAALPCDRCSPPATRARADQAPIPFPAPIEATAGVVSVNFVEFAVIPDAAGGEAPRMMHLVDEPGTKRPVRQHHARPDLQRQLRRQDGDRVSSTSTRRSGSIGVQSQGSERGFQSFAFHPQFNQRGTRGYGKFYTYTDTTNMTPTPDFTHPARRRTRTTRCCSSGPRRIPRPRPTTADAPRELLRVAQPFANHNGGQIAFNDLATPGTAGLRPALHRLRRRRQRRRSR